MRSLIKKVFGNADGFRPLVVNADAARDRSDWSIAADGYEAALAIRPNAAPIWVQLGNVSKEARDFARAEFAYRRALQLRPTDADTHLQIGHLHKVSGDLAGALQSYTMANHLNPSNASAASEKQALESQLQTYQVPISAPPRSPPAPSAARPPNRTVPRKLSFNARVLGTKNALEELLRPAHNMKPSIAAGLDLARPAMIEAIAALEQIAKGEHGAAPHAQSALGAVVTIVFDVSDLIQYFRHHRLPTGIQRVQIEAISVALLQSDSQGAVRICCFTEEDDYWREVPPEIFLDLCELSLIAGDWTAPEWRELMTDLDDLLHQSANFSFSEGAYLINIGTSWWLQNYFLKVREAKQRSNIRYIPFVHDMIPIMAPEYCVEGLVKDFVGWAQGVYRHADFYFVNSEATRTDLISVGRRLGYEVDADLIRIVRLDADYRKPGLKLPDALGSLKQHRLAPRNYILFVSTIEARKNHVSIFDAWITMCKNHGDDAVPKLVCVGSRGWLNEAIFAKLAGSTRLREKVVILSNVSDEDLAILYRECLFSVYPSFYEGWGLPVTEALSYGKPVLVSRSSSLPEAGGEFVDYFRLGDSAELTSHLERLIFDHGYRAERETMIGAGFKTRSWQSIAEDFQNAVLEWSNRRPTGWKGAPAIELGRYYPFSRNTEITIFYGLQSGEIFRSGNGWWGANEWGCWLKPGPAEIAFSLPKDTTVCRLYVGLQGPPGRDTPFDLTILPRKKTNGIIKSGLVKWVVVEFDGLDVDHDVQVVLEGFTRHEERPGEDVKPIVVSVAVVGLFFCATSDSAARARFAEAISLDDMTGLARLLPDQSNQLLEG